MIKEKKRNIREEMKSLRKDLNPDLRKKLNASLEKLAIELIEKRAPKIIHIYISLKDEFQTRSIIEYCWRKDISVIVPETLGAGELRHWEYRKGDELLVGKFDCQWPYESLQYQGNYDMIFCPGLAFNELGVRLGYGGGYYDRFLASHPNAEKIAFAYPFQIIDLLPSEKHDCQLDNILIAEV
jgi:5-formyltetrahydrofolate cyclo-ligase